MNVKIATCDDCKCTRVIMKDYYGAFNLCGECFERLYSDANSILRKYAKEAIEMIEKKEDEIAAMEGTKQQGVLYMMCGVPGSGKSTWVKKHIWGTAAHISRDAIRFSMLGADDDYFSKETEVFDEFCKQIKENLEKGVDVYADATHLNASSRAKVLNKVKDSARKIEAICIEEPIEICLERNNLRTGRAYVPPSAIRRMYSQYTRPERSEGFSNVIVYGSFNF